MPTNILRQIHAGHHGAAKPAPSDPRIAVLKSGSISIRLGLAATETANRIWNALPLYSNAERWGQCVRFEVPVRTGRDRTARINATVGEIYFWVEDERILVPFGPTPISRPGQCRLASPSNIWAVALDDVRALAAVQGGDMIGLEAVPTSTRT